MQVGDPGPGEVRVRNTAVGLNFIDTYHRSGLYPLQLPITLGSEGAGVVEKVGPRVKDFKPGDRVAYASPIGAHAEVCLRPAEKLVKIPAGVDDKVAALIEKRATDPFEMPRYCQAADTADEKVHPESSLTEAATAPIFDTRLDGDEKDAALAASWKRTSC